ncbi:MAG: AAC(3) family N-acetyltransferase, partial [Planctomycetota bacterium]
GGIDVDHAACRIVGLMISANQGKELRRLLDEHGRVTVRIDVDVRKYVGTHDVVSGVVLGRDDPQDEAWAIAHSSEPGAVDNASGVAVCVEIARLLEELAGSGELPRPRRSIRLLSGYECHGFFRSLENTWREKTPLAGVCIDSVGVRPSACNGRLGWNATTPMTAGFVDPLGACILRKALRLTKPGYRLSLGPFVSTPDTLIADPKYGFPCGYIETDRGKNGAFDAYHSSADTPDLLSVRGLAACAGAMAGYLYFLADAATPELLELADWETDRALARLDRKEEKITPDEAAFIPARHHASMERLKRWMWGGDRDEILSHLADRERRVREAAKAAARPTKTARRPRGAGRVPVRTAPLTPFAENAPGPVAGRIAETGLPRWALYWSDGVRDLAEIAGLIACERGEDVTVEQVAAYFEAHDELGYVDLVRPSDVVTQTGLVRDLKALGVRKGMDLMVHSSLSSIGHVRGGAGTVVEALLAAIGRTGTLVMPSFNHHEAFVYNPMTTPTKNGAIPDAMWRRPDAVRSIQPSHPVAAIGPKAEELCAGHLEAGIWAADSPIGKVIQQGGAILSIGVRQTSSTAYHVAEISMGGGCLDQFARPERYVDRDGTVREVRGLAWRDGGCPISPRKLDAALDEAGLRRHGKVGHADATLVQAFDVWQMRRQHLKHACPTCDIEPRTTFRTRYPDYLERRQ